MKTAPNLNSPSETNAEAVVARIQQRRENFQRQISKVSFRWWLFFLFCFGGAISGLFIGNDMNPEPPFWEPVLMFYIAGGTVLGAILNFVGLWYFRFILTTAAKAQDQLLTGAGIKTLQEKLEEDFFTKLVKINFKYIDQYYLQTQSQADKSFSLCAWVAAFGLLVIVAGIVLMYLGKTTPAYVTAASGVLGEFIAAVFFYLYNRTILKMSQYHQKLVITQNVSLAMKIAEGLPTEERVKAQQELINRLTYDVNKYLTGFAETEASGKSA